MHLSWDGGLERELGGGRTFPALGVGKVGGPPTCVFLLVASL